MFFLWVCVCRELSIWHTQFCGFCFVFRSSRIVYCVIVLLTNCQLKDGKHTISDLKSQKEMPLFSTLLHQLSIQNMCTKYFEKSFWCIFDLFIAIFMFIVIQSSPIFKFVSVVLFSTAHTLEWSSCVIVRQWAFIGLVKRIDTWAVSVTSNGRKSLGVCVCFVLLWFCSFNKRNWIEKTNSKYFYVNQYIWLFSFQRWPNSIRNCFIGLIHLN